MKIENKRNKPTRDSRDRDETAPAFKFSELNNPTIFVKLSPTPRDKNDRNEAKDRDRSNPRDRELTTERDKNDKTTRNNRDRTIFFELNNRDRTTTRNDRDHNTIFFYLNPKITSSRPPNNRKSTIFVSLDPTRRTKTTKSRPNHTKPTRTKRSKSPKNRERSKAFTPFYTPRLPALGPNNIWQAVTPTLPPIFTTRGSKDGGITSINQCSARCPYCPTPYVSNFNNTHSKINIYNNIQFLKHINIQIFFIFFREKSKIKKGNDFFMYTFKTSFFF
jgi:hypothetical protein